MENEVIEFDIGVGGGGGGGGAASGDEALDGDHHALDEEMADMMEIRQIIVLGITPGASLSNCLSRVDHFGLSCISANWHQDDMDKKIHDLTHELDCANRKCDVYRANLISVLRDIEDHKQQLSVKVQNIKLSMKDDGL
ncbi:hypothetical protein TEA_003732 [Camellia sinensis var. sinensis]|uniref:Uncharacterized protein n=1 Tax=Camellia sinensis var. sinensis TaxID=542762 RepID=A0A4S4D522_CAMSN|nr:hypothetical protein TEA_003732 [Camellia sinensis var. sinensis]